MRSRAAAASVALAGTFLVAGMALRSWELVSLLLPLSAVLLVFVLLDRPVEIALEASWSLEQDQILAGDEVECVLDLRCRAGGADLGAVEVSMPQDVEVLEGEPTFPIALNRDEAMRVRYRLRFSRRGTYRLGPVRVTAMGFAGLTASEHECGSVAEVRVLPKVYRLDRTWSSSSKWRLASGNIDSKLLGPGIEFFNLRGYLPGDSLRAVNWKATARLDAITVNDFMTQRSCDVIVALDLRGMTNEGQADISVDMAASLCGYFLEQRNRVGLAAFSDFSKVLPMGYGRRQLQSCLEVLADSRMPRDHPPLKVAESLDRFFPRDSLVVLVTALTDDRAGTTVQKLLWQGREMLVVAPFAVPDRPDLKERMNEVRRQDRAFQLRRLCRVAEWDASQPQAWSLPRGGR